MAAETLVGVLTDPKNKMIASWEELREQLVRALRLSGVNEKSANEMHYPLMHAITRKTFAEEAVLFLLQEGADPNVCDRNGRTPLVVAVEQNAAAIITILIQYGADRGARTNSIDGRRLTAFDIAAGKGETFAAAKYALTPESFMRKGNV